MSERDIATALRSRLVLADGSTGTALAELAPERRGTTALLPLEEPKLVLELHRAYLAAGAELLETASFSASARSLARAGISVDCRELNRGAAALARRACEEASDRDGRARWVAGSVGPGEESPSLGAVGRAELTESFLPQMLGLLEGGADLILLETCQDPLQIKAAVAALMTADRRLGRRTPFAVSATVDASGRLLTGTSMEALVAILAPFGPVALGLNCSGGPETLAEPLERLAAVSPFPLSLMPNAGTPRLVDGVAAFTLGPEEFAQRVAGLARRGGAALVGGCCGTGPEHIAALARALADRPAPAPRPARRPALASLYGAQALGAGLCRIGERANAAGSAAFARLAEAGDVEAMAGFALAQEARGVEALDLHVARPGRNEAADLAALAGALAVRARAALCLDSTDPEALAAALERYPGRALVNSASLEDPDKARRIFALARDEGAAVVCLCLGPRGPARSAGEKLELALELAGLARQEGLEMGDLLFDPLTFPLAAASKGLRGAARETLEAIGRLKAAMPGARTVLGVGNVSYGLPKKLRPAVTAIFLEEARRAGLDAAILDSGGLPEIAQLPDELVAAVRRLLRAGPEEDTAGDLEALLAQAGLHAAAASPEIGAPSRDPAAALGAAVERGDPSAALEAGRLVLAAGAGVEAYSRLVAEALGRVGEGFSRGSLPLPLVLRSAEAAEGALGLLAGAGGPGAGRGSIVLATVRGDLHDIGKNLAGLILGGAGYRVVDLGVDVGLPELLAAAEREGALAVGLSGLLLRSLPEMEAAAAALTAAGSPALLLLGGAAVDPAYVAERIEPQRPGLVRVCGDAFEALRALEAFASPGSGGRAARPGDEGPQFSVSANAPGRGRRETGPGSAFPRARAASPEAGAAPTGLPEPEDIGAEELLGVLDRATLLELRWGFGRGRRAEAEALLEEHLGEFRERGLLAARALRGLFPCSRAGEALLVEAPGPPVPAFRFPRPPEERRSPLDSLPEEEPGLAAFLAVTLGPTILERAREERRAGRHGAYHRIHCLGAALAEAAAEAAHRRFRAELTVRGLAAQALRRRLSFGFPYCPGLESQEELLGLLGADRIGLGITPGCQLVPEFSVTALLEPFPLSALTKGAAS